MVLAYAITFSDVTPVKNLDDFNDCEDNSLNALAVVFYRAGPPPTPTTIKATPPEPQFQTSQAPLLPAYSF